MNCKTFDALLPEFEATYEQWQQDKLRQQAVGGGRKAQLETSCEKLFFILFYFKCYPTFDLAGILFEFDRSQAYKWAHRLREILEKTLGQKQVLPERKVRTVQEFMERFPGVERVMIDARERPIARPKDPHKQRQTKAENRTQSGSRVLCENAFSGVKRDRAVSDVYRNHKAEFDDRLMLTAAGLWNYYLEAA